MLLRLFFVCCFAVAVVFFSMAAFAGKVELTTYYPAPYGEYSSLKATGKTASDSDTAFTAKGSTGTGLVVTNGNKVGIGTATPQATLDLRGANASNGTVALQAGGSAGTGLVVTNGNNVGIGTASPQGILDLNSTSAAFFPPRVTTAQRNAIASVTVAEPGKKGAIVYNTTTNTLESYDGNMNWKTAGGGSLAWKTSTAKQPNGYTGISSSTFFNDTPVGPCFCSNNADVNDISDSWLGALVKNSDRNHMDCDKEDKQNCNKTYVHYLVPA